MGHHSVINTTTTAHAMTTKPRQGLTPWGTIDIQVVTDAQLWPNSLKRRAK